MHRFRDALNERDLAHLRRVLGEQEDPTFSETRRRFRVNQLTMDDTYVDDGALAPLQALPQADRERLISDVVWRLTCHVEGSTTRGKSKGHKLEGGFRMMLMVKEGRPIFSITKPVKK
jgi:hypothetical protein